MQFHLKQIIYILRTKFFWVIMQRVVIISYRLFRTTYWFHQLFGTTYQSYLEDGIDRFSQNIDKKLQLLTE